MTQEISIQLSASIIYVTGTVNGVSVEFTLAENNTWCAVVEKSENQIYDVEIIGYDSLGHSTTYSLKLYYGFLVITDRTWEDVIHRTTKGCYTADDFNRVGTAIVYLAEKLNEYGYHPSVDVKINWFVSDIPPLSLMETYLANVQALINAYYTLTTTPAPPASMANLTFTDANNIEQILLDMNTLLENMIAQFKFSDTFYCGEV